MKINRQLLIALSMIVAGGLTAFALINSPPQTDRQAVIAHFLSALLQRLVQLQVRVQRHDDLVLENALVFEEQTRERQAHRLGPLG